MFKIKKTEEPDDIHINYDNINIMIIICYYYRFSYCGNKKITEDG